MARRKNHRGRWAIWVVVLAVVVGGLGLALASRGDRTDSGESPRGEPLAGVEVLDGNLSRQHVAGDIVYARQPPVGGPHAPVWQNCGFYAEAVPEERAVHSLEHGTVWLTYQPELSPDQVQRLRDLVRSGKGEGFLLVSPYPGQPAPVVATDDVPPRGGEVISG